MPISNDPNAGSPTITLLRLLLPLNDKVQTASKSIRLDRLPSLMTIIYSEVFTGSFNR